MRLRMFTAPAQQTGLPPKVEPCVPALAEHGHAEGQTAADALCRGDDVGLQTVVHIAVEAAAAAVAELDLVCHEQQVMLAADLLQAGGEFLPDGAHAALALHGLKEDRGAGVLCGKALEGFAFAGLRVEEAAGQRLIVAVEHILPRRGQRAERAAVEAAAQGDDVAVFRALVFGGPFAGGLDGAFVGFRAGVREKDPLQAGSFAEHLCELRGRFGVVEIGDMLEAAELRRNGIAPFVVVHAEDIHADAAAEVDVLPPVRAAEERALAADDLQRKTVIGVGKILLIECLRKHN